MQWSQSTLGEPVLIIFWDTPQFSDTTLSSLLLQGAGFSLSCMAISLAKIPLKVSLALFFQTVKFHGRWHSIMLE